MILSVSFRSHRGIDVLVPQDLVRPGNLPSFREGFSIHLFREPDKKAGQPARPQQAGGTAEAPWVEIRPEADPVHHEATAMRTLGPTDSARTLRLDLADFFVIGKPGNFCVELRLEALRGEEGKPGVLARTFTLEL